MAGNPRACKERGQGVSPPFTFGKSPALTVGTAPGGLLFQLQWGSSNPFLPGLGKWEHLPSG